MLIKDVNVNYKIIDTTIKNDIPSISIFPDTDSKYSNVNNTLNSDNKAKLASLEKDYFLLDGSFVFPYEDSVGVYKIGFESDTISDEYGNMAHVQEIEYQFAAPHNSVGIQLQFQKDCAVKGLDILFYNGTSLLKAKSISNNTQSVLSIFTELLNWDKIIIYMYKTNPMQRIRLQSVTFGIDKSYTADDLITVNASKSADTSGDYSESGECTISVFNDETFQFKSLREMPESLQSGMTLEVYANEAKKDKYELFQTYISEATKITENGNILGITAYDKLYSLNDTTYKRGTVRSHRSLMNWALDVADDAGVDIDIDDEFDEIFSDGYISEVPHREALRLIAEAGCGLLYVDEKGNIHLSKKQTQTSDIEVTNDDIVGGTLEEDSGEQYLGVCVVGYDFILENQAKEVGRLDDLTLDNQLRTFEITYNSSPVNTNSLSIETVGGVNSAKIVTFSAERMTVAVSGDSSQTSYVVVFGRAYATATFSAEKGNQSKNVKKIENNYLITGDLAEQVANYQYSQLVGKYRYSAEVLTDDTIQLLENVNLQDKEITVDKIEIGLSYGERSVKITGTENSEEV